MAKESDKKSVPTLIDVIIPGEANTESQGKETPPAIPSPTPPSNRPCQTLNRPSPAPSLMEAKIETLVARILNKHMEDMRKEITRRVITDVRSYLGRDTR